MRFVFILMTICGCVLSLKAQNASLSETTLLNIKFEQKTGSRLPGELKFRDETGKSVVLLDYFGNKPTILIMGYYGCPMLCTLVLNGVMENLRQLNQTTHLSYQLVFVSIDPHETPAIAYQKKRMYAQGYGGQPDDWHFLTGDTNSIRQMANAIGFRFAYDPAAKQYAHPSGFVVLTPAGKISRYFMGVTYSARELNDALQSARADQTGIDPSPLNLLCFHYAPISGKYGKLALNTVRAGGVITFIALVCFLVVTGYKHGRSG